MGYVDLHLHTTASDGVLSPAEIVRYAKAKGLQAIAITDHDTIEGCEEGLSEGGRIGFGISTMAGDIDRDGDIDLLAPGKSGLYLLENQLKN